MQKIKDWILNNKYKTAQIITAVILIVLLVFLWLRLGRRTQPSL